MIPGDAQEAFELLVRQQQLLSPAVRATVQVACAQAPALEQAVLALLEADTSTESVFRLLAMPVHGALAGDFEPALPVCVLSRLWWVGAELLDDVMDGQFDPRTVGMSAATVTIAGTACLTLLPQEIVAHLPLTDDRKATLNRELNHATIASADGQLADIAPHGAPLTWQGTMTGYAGKTGAAYGRDAALAALLAGRCEQEIRGWRTFGRLFGVLRQTANDRAPLSAMQDTDLANGTPTLLLAYALESLPLAESEELRLAHVRAGEDNEARSAVWERLRQPDVGIGYDRRLAMLRGRLSALLQQLVAPSPHRDVLQWMVNVSARDSQLANRNGIADGIAA